MNPRRTLSGFVAFIWWKIPHMTLCPPAAGPPDKTTPTWIIDKFLKLNLNN